MAPDIHKEMQVFSTHYRFRHAYEPLLAALLSSRVEERNERTGKSIKMLRHPVSFTLDLRDRLLPHCGIRKMFPATAAAEVAWFIMATQDPTFIRSYAPIWDKFIETWQDVEEVDFATNRPILSEPVTGIKAAYGYRWRKHFGRDQLLLAINALLENRSDRRIWVQAWDPAEDGLGAKGQMNVPCPVGFTFSVVDGQLNSSLFIRSSDVFVGLPYDVMGHALLMDAVVWTLNAQSVANGGQRPIVDLGYMHVTLAHPHVYDVHYDMARQALEGKPVDDSFVMPPWTVWGIEEAPHAYVERIKALQRTMPQPAFSCRPEVVA